jgi:ribosomal protein S2
VDAERLRAEAVRCRLLAGTLANQSTVDMLNRMADEFEQAAAAQETQLFFSGKQSKGDE